MVSIIISWGLGIGDWGLGPIPNPLNKIYLFLIKLTNNNE